MSKKKIVILTGDEYRHEYFRKRVALHPDIDVLATYCEGVEKSLENRTKQNPNSSEIEIEHVKARTQSEIDFFAEAISDMQDVSLPRKIPKGTINDDKIVEEIIHLAPDILICYGSSIIKSKLLELFYGKFLNVHLGLSPYYRGSGTNVWPLINKEPYMVGATYMYIDAGIDTGKIIHQIRADLFLEDTPHTIGNRLIKKMTDVYCQVISAFDNLNDEKQPIGGGKLYLQKDFDVEACNKLYKNFEEGMIEKYINDSEAIDIPYIVKNSALENSE